MRSPGASLRRSGVPAVGAAPATTNRLNVLLSAPAVETVAIVRIVAVTVPVTAAADAAPTECRRYSEPADEAELLAVPLF